MVVLDLFSGIGGFALGFRWAGLAPGPVAFCEIDPFCRSVLHQHWPDVPVFGDVHELSDDAVRSLGEIDLVCGGFPCQPFSVAGVHRGTADERHLWPEMFRVICAARPTWVLAENVPGIRNRAADLVCGDLESVGYTCWPTVVGAEAVEAPHRRNRVWFLAHAGRGAMDDTLLPRCDRATHALQAGGNAAERAGCLADTSGARHGAQPGGVSGNAREDDGRRAHLDYKPALRCGTEREPLSGPGPGGDWPAGRGAKQHGWEKRRCAQLPVGRKSDGVSVKLVRGRNKSALGAYGNAVVPQVVEAFGRVILAAEEAWYA